MTQIFNYTLNAKGEQEVRDFFKSYHKDFQDKNADFTSAFIEVEDSKNNNPAENGYIEIGKFYSTTGNPVTESFLDCFFETELIEGY